MSAYESVYKAQCITWKIAQSLTNQFADATPGYMVEKPPYCLRIVPAYRNETTKAFRKMVADEMRYMRAKK